MKFKEKYNFEERIIESNKLKIQYPSKIPIIIEKSIDCTNINDLDKNKYLVPDYLTLAQFIFVIRKRLNLDSHKVIFFFCDNKLFPVSSTILEIFEKNKDTDGFLYFVYTSENTFG